MCWRRILRRVEPEPKIFELETKMFETEPIFEPSQAPLSSLNYIPGLFEPITLDSSLRASNLEPSSIPSLVVGGIAAKWKEGGEGEGHSRTEERQQTAATAAGAAHFFS